MLQKIVEITKLIKFRPKREQLLGEVKENFEMIMAIVDNDNSFKQNDSLAKLCITCWTVRENAFIKVINNFGPLFEL